MRVPFTAHVAIGADIGHFHPTADGADLGETTHTDFRLLAEMVRRMDGGGAYLNGHRIHVSKPTQVGDSLVATGFPSRKRPENINISSGCWRR